MATGLWKTEGSKTPNRIGAGEFARMANPSDIRGSYTFEDIENNFNVSAEIIAQAFALDTSEKAAKDYKAKDLETIYESVSNMNGEVGTDSIKLFVSLYLGISYNPEETTLLPNPALNILRDKGAISEEQFQLLKQKSISPINLKTSEPSIIDDSEKVIQGNTTFANLLDWGMTKSQIEEIIGISFSSNSQTLRDFLLENGLELSDFKDDIQKILDNL